MKDYPDATLPVIAGNVSFYNESAEGSIPPSPMISCLGMMPNVSRVMTYDLKRAETMLVLVGERKDECGGSVYYQLQNELGSQLPKPDLASFSKEIHAVHAAIEQHLVLSAHDISEGGVAVALAEMSFKNRIGVKIELTSELSDAKNLFSETGGFIFEVARDKMKDLKKLFAEYDVPFIVIGETINRSIIKNEWMIDLAVMKLELHGKMG